MLSKVLNSLSVFCLLQQYLLTGLSEGWMRPTCLLLTCVNSQCYVLVVILFVVTSCFSQLFSLSSHSSESWHAVCVSFCEILCTKSSTTTNISWWLGLLLLEIFNAWAGLADLNQWDLNHWFKSRFKSIFCQKNQVI